MTMMCSTFYCYLEDNQRAPVRVRLNLHSRDALLFQGLSYIQRGLESEGLQLVSAAVALRSPWLSCASKSTFSMFSEHLVDHDIISLTREKLAVRGSSYGQITN